MIASIYRPKTTLSVLIYLLLGAIGLPVFAGGHGGISSFYGPTAGFLFFFPLRALVTSSLLAKRDSPFVSS
ncbi:MAG: biotin transporter BioY [Streptococcus sp.]